MGDARWRNRLSRTSDRVLYESAAPSRGAVIVSHWRHDALHRESGTAITPFLGLGVVVEVHCRCDPGTAAQRFTERTRHAGHLDAQGDPVEVVERFRRLSALGPVGVLDPIVVDTTVAPDVAGIADAVRTRARGETGVNPAS